MVLDFRCSIRNFGPSTAMYILKQFHEHYFSFLKGTYVNNVEWISFYVKLFVHFQCGPFFQLDFKPVESSFSFSFYFYSDGERRKQLYTFLMEKAFLFNFFFDNVGILVLLTRQDYSYGWKRSLLLVHWVNMWESNTRLWGTSPCLSRKSQHSGPICARSFPWNMQ